MKIFHKLIILNENEKQKRNICLDPHVLRPTSVSPSGLASAEDLRCFGGEEKIGVWGRGAQTGNSLKRGVCVYERVACVMERRRMLPGQIRGSKCTSAAASSSAAAPRISAVFVSVLSRRCLGFCLVVVSVVSVLSRPTSPKLPITQRVALSVQ